jgi:hypothetical protein
VGRTSWTGDQPVARPLPTHRKPRVRFELTMPLFVHALECEFQPGYGLSEVCSVFPGPAMKQAAPYSDLYSGSTRFEPRPDTDNIEIFHCVPRSSMKVLGSYLKLGHGRLFPHPLQFIIHCSSNAVNTRCVVRVTENIVR